MKHDALWPILKQAIRHPRRVAVIDDQRQWRYLDLVGGALHVAKLIKANSDRPHVGVMLPTSGAFAVAMLATWLLRRTIVPINYLLSEAERQYVIDHSEIDLLITAGPMLDFVEGQPRNVKLLKLDEQKFGKLPPLRLPPLNIRGDELAALLYTSGTSGRPKGVMLTHRNIRADVFAAAEHAQLTQTNGFVGVLPQFHSFGLTALTVIPLTLGAQVIYTARFVPSRLIKLIAKHKPDILMAIPSMYNALANVKNAAPEDLASIKLAISGAEPLPASVYEAFEAKFNLRILEGYGLTETSPVVAWSLPHRNRRGTVGPVFPGVDVRIVDPQNRPLDVGEEGEITIAGPIVMAGYYKQPDLTEQVIDGEGYFHTGDMGRIDEDGLLAVTGRIKEMLIVGGENVFPREIEEVLMAHPSIQSAGVVGKTDPSRGEVPIAFVEVVEGETFDEPALRTWCRERLAGYKVPREIHPVDELPRSPTGKVLRRKLSDRVAEKQG